MVRKHVVALTLAGLLGLPAVAGAAITQDTGFGNGGGVLRDNFGTTAQARGAAVFPGDKGVVVVGDGTEAGGTDPNDHFMSVALYTEQGKLDPFFGPMPGAGRARLKPSPGAAARANDVIVDGQGRIVIVGTIGDETARNRSLVIARLLRTGGYDPTFGDPVSPGSATRTGFHIEPQAQQSDGRGVAAQAGGYVVVGAQACPDITRTCTLLQRYNEAGERVASGTRFNSGLLKTAGLNAVAINGDGTIDVAGEATLTDGGPTAGVTYVHQTDGTYVDGSYRTTPDAAFKGISVNALQNFSLNLNRSFGAVGQAGTQLIRRQFSSAGVPDAGLSNGGVFRLAAPPNTEGAAASAQPSGKTIVAGSTGTATASPLLARVTPANDTAEVFVQNGVGASARWTAVTRPVVDAAGRAVVYAAGAAGTTSLVARYVVALAPVVAASMSKTDYAVGETPQLTYATADTADGGSVFVTRVTVDGTEIRTTIGPENRSQSLSNAGGTHTVVVTAEDDEGLVTTRTLTYTLAVADPNADTDGDGLRDTWETTGDIDGDGKQDLDLEAMGADPKRKDVFVRLDYMAGHQLDRTALRDITTAFAAAPVTNPDGTNGISLHLDHGADSLMDPKTNKTWGTLSTAASLKHTDALGTYGTDKKYDWTAFDKLRPASVNANVRRVFRYAMSIHKFANRNNSGTSRPAPGSDFLVSFGGKGAQCGDAKITDCTVQSDISHARTVMHELGHTLGLRHGGGDDLNNKPNFPSIMNYLFQFPGASGPTTNFGRTDYGRLASPQVGDVDESKLSESAGITASGVAAGHRSAFVCLGKDKNVVANVKTFALGAAMDWNCNGKVDKGTVSGSMDGLPDTVRPLSKLPAPAKSDWASIVFARGSIGATGAETVPPRRTAVDEAPTSLLARFARLASGDAKAPSLRLTPPAARPRAGKPFVLKVVARDNKRIDRVQLLVDGKRSQQVLTKPSVLGLANLKPKLTLTRGVHRVSVIVTDATGNVEGRVLVLKVR